ncbi:MAG TPA: urea amidolyase associated protein UAAP1 [Stellaceae bacterium]|nr:urea amidolyase associated protein UAAP1 [Stellaceae bacterium]
MTPRDPYADLPTTPDDFRRRYDELKRSAEAKRARAKPGAMPGNPVPLPDGLVIHEEVIPGGWYWTARIERGQSLRLVSDHGTSGVALMFWNAAEPTERYNAADTIKLQWNAVLTKGCVLFSDMGRVMFSITDDTAEGWHDTLTGGSSPASPLADPTTPGNPIARNTRDNLRLGAAKLGLSRRDLAPALGFFTPIRTDDKGGFLWQKGKIQPGAHVDLRAEMDMLIAVSNCPHPLAPKEESIPKPIRALLWRSPPPTVDDLCRIASDEAIRGFENNAAYYR